MRLRQRRIRVIFLSIICLGLFSYVPFQSTFNPEQTINKSDRQTIGTPSRLRTLDPADTDKIASLMILDNLSDTFLTINGEKVKNTRIDLQIYENNPASLYNAFRTQFVAVAYRL